MEQEACTCIIIFIYLMVELFIITNMSMTNRFRLMAFDHDLFSFSDVTLGSWPLILVTNPKDARFLSPSREPTRRMLHSSHVRMLVFSHHKLVSLRLIINEEQLPTPVPVNSGPLYVSPWQPTKYANGLHVMRVEAVDSIGSTSTYRQTFSLDNTLAPIDLLPQLLLFTDVRSLVWN